MDVKNALKRDWSSIPPELLNSIAKSIREISDFIRFRAVCSTWRSSIQITALPTQFPWISERRLGVFGDLTFYSINFRKTYRIRTTNSSGKFLYGPSEGYMFTQVFDGTKANVTSPRSLLNPLNNHEIPLPSYNHRYYFAQDCNCSWIGPRQNQMWEYVAFVCDEGLRVWHPGQNEWCNFCLVSDEPCSYFCLKGMIFGVEKLNGITTIIDINNTSAHVIPPVEGHLSHGNVYIVEAYENILRVFTHSDREYSTNCQFDVHRLDASENSSACWVKIHNIGDQAIFIDTYGGFVINASETAGIKRNCIYFLKRIESTTIYEIIRIDIETRTKEVFECPFSRPLGWFMPNLHHIQNDPYN